MRAGILLPWAYTHLSTYRYLTSMYTYLMFLCTYIYVYIIYIWISHILYIDTGVQTAKCVHICTNKHLTSRHTNVLNICMYIYIYMHKISDILYLLTVARAAVRTNKGADKGGSQTTKAKKKTGTAVFWWASRRLHYSCETHTQKHTQKKKADSK